MGGKGNGKAPEIPEAEKRSYKGGQKNVSVYLGRKDGWQNEALRRVCVINKCSESEFFRSLFLDCLAKWQLYDPETKKPIMANINKLPSKAATTQMIPDVLDLNEFKREKTDE